MDASNIVSIQPNLDFTNKRELGSEAVFTISTAKPGNGVDQLRDNNLDTYWQSDGIAPHLITIQFPKKLLYLKYAFTVITLWMKVILLKGFLLEVAQQCMI